MKIAHTSFQEKFTNNFIIEVSSTTLRLTKLFSRGVNITYKENIHEIWYYSVIVEILIHLKDLTQKLKKLNDGIHFTDDIPESEKYKDITSLIGHFRDAVCHNDSQRRRNAKGYLFAGNVFAGYDYEDDITILMGDSKVLVKRHLLRTYKEVLNKLISYKCFDTNDDFRQAVDLAKNLELIS